MDGKDEWTPVVKRKRKATRVKRSSESESSSSEVDVSCSRKVKYEKHEGIPGLKIYHSGPATWTCLLYTSPSPRDATLSRMPSSA